METCARALRPHGVIGIGLSRSRWFVVVVVAFTLACDTPPTAVAETEDDQSWGFNDVTDEASQSQSGGDDVGELIDENDRRGDSTQGVDREDLDTNGQHDEDESVDDVEDIEIAETVNDTVSLDEVDDNDAAENDEDGEDADVVVVDIDPTSEGGPFAPQPVTDEGLVNISYSLEEILEFGTLPEACADYEADPTSRKKMLRCGKYMFFYEAFGTPGIPAPLYNVIASNFVDEIGEGFSHYGTIPDPYSTEHRFVGAVDGASLTMGTPTVAFGCASCHFGQLPDGRYAAGAPNLNYDYGGHMMALLLAPERSGLGWDPSEHDPVALEKAAPVLDRLDDDYLLRLEINAALATMAIELDTPIPEMDQEMEQMYASWKTGTMDFMISPLPVDDGVHIISKVIALWGIPDDKEQEEAGMEHALLAWSGGSWSLEQFLMGFVAVSDASTGAWTEERMMPVAEYIRSLRAPENLSPPPSDDVELGKDVFVDNCLDCHAGPRGSGTELYDFDEIGTDHALQYWADPDFDGEVCCNLFDDYPESELTHKLKSPRLQGLWALNRFLHNGSVDTLEELLCVDGPREPITALAYANSGHEFGCDLVDDDKLKLIAFLKSL